MKQTALASAEVSDILGAKLKAYGIWIEKLDVMEIFISSDMEY